MLPGNPAISGAEQVFDSRPVWTLHRQGDTIAFKIFDHLNDQKRILVLDPDIRTAKLYFPNPVSNFINPFYGPTIELFRRMGMFEDPGTREAFAEAGVAHA